MGCGNSVPRSNVTTPQTKVHPINSSSAEKEGSFKVRITEAIKRKDSILFEKILQKYQVKYNDLSIGFEQKRNLLHQIAETNFADGMLLTLEYLSIREPTKVSQLINALDALGNTPAMICCLFDSSETLDVLLRYDVINLNVKNTEGKTAMELATEASSTCANILNINGSVHARSTHRQIHDSVEIANTPKILTTHSLLYKNSFKERALSLKDRTMSLNDTKEPNTPLSSVESLTKETFAKLHKNTKLYSLILELKKYGMNFIDEEFPHSLFSALEDDCEENFGNLSSVIKWLRPPEFLNQEMKKIKVFEAIDLNEVAQSDLAGCELYSALAAMTEFPQRLLNTFISKEVNKYGAYSVKFLISGIPVEILLDDYFPCIDNSRLIYSKPTSNELWFLLLEKAFAKLYGGYSEVRKISVEEALELMTSMPSSSRNLKDIDTNDLWDNLADYDNKNYIVCAGTYQDHGDKKNKIFTMVNLYETLSYRIVKLRNHFQDFIWEGMFSEKSKLWTKELRDEIGFTKGEKSCIYMELQEFIKYFDFLAVCHYHEGWIRNRIDVTSSSNKAVFFEMNIERETEVFISVHQKLPRYITESPDYSISPVEILIAQEGENETLKKIAIGEKDAFLGKQTTYASDDIKLNLPEGKYIIRVKVLWTDCKQHEFSLNTYSNNTLSVQRVPSEIHKNFLEKLYIDWGSNMNEKYQLSNSCEFLSAWLGPHLWIYGSNKGTKTWNLEIEFQKMKNLKLSKKFTKSENTMELVIPPGKQKIAYLKRVNSEQVELLWNMNHAWHE